MTEVAVSPERAVELLARLREQGEQVRDGISTWHVTLVEIHDTAAYKHFGFRSWSAFVKDELGWDRSYADRMRVKGAALKMLEVAGIGTRPSSVSGRAAVVIVSNPEVVAEAKAASEAGEAPARAVRDAVAKHRPTPRTVSDAPIMAETHEVAPAVVDAGPEADPEPAPDPAPTDATAAPEERPVSYSLPAVDPRSSGAADQAKTAARSLILLLESVDLVEVARQLKPDEFSTVQAALSCLVEAYGEAHPVKRARVKAAKKAATPIAESGGCDHPRTGGHPAKTKGKWYCELCEREVDVDQVSA